MSTAGQTKFPCPQCGFAQADLLSATECYVTAIDDQTEVRSNRLNSTAYQLKCPKCQNVFSVTVVAD